MSTQTRQAGYRQPASDLAGVKTFVSEKPSKGIDAPSGDSSRSPGEAPRSDRDRALPKPPSNKQDQTEHRKGPPVYNVPGYSDSGQKVPVRTLGKPGGEYGHPWKYDGNSPTRRVDASDDMGLDDPDGMDLEASLIPTHSQRQRKQRGQAKRYYQRYYRRNRGKIRRRSRMRYKRLRRNPRFKRKQKLRRDPRYKNRFRRLPSGGVSSTKERSKHDRKKADLSEPIGFCHILYGWGDVVDLQDDGVLAHLDGEWEECTVIPLDEFLHGVVFDSIESSEAFFDALEEAFDTPDPRWVAATFYREVFTPGHNLDPGEGSQDLGLKTLKDQNEEADERRPPGHSLSISQTTDNPGSAKVIPSGKGFVNKEASAIRVAKRLEELLGGTGLDVVGRSGGLQPKGKKFNPKTSMFSFNVPSASGKGVYTVKVKALRKGNVVKLSKMDIQVSCSCPFWRWQGPEHWAKAGSYLYGKPVGTAANPNVKDPRGKHLVCKHVVACLRSIRDWELPRSVE